MNLKQIVTAPLKALKEMVFPRVSNWFSWKLPRTNYNYKKEVGEGYGASVIMAPVLWIARTFPEAPVMLEQVNSDGEYEEVREHDFLRLLQNPNPAYSAASLWMGTLLSYTLDGNAYWMKIRSASRKVVELWYVPHTLIEPKVRQNSNQYVDYYEYTPGNVEPIKVPPEDVIHFKYGIDPQNTRKGFSPLYPVLREVFTDLEASNFTASMLRNYGAPSVIISPKKDGYKVDAEGIKEKFMQKFTGDRRGEPLVPTSPVDVQNFGASMKDMDLSQLRNIPEERVCAVLGIPAAVVGFGTGLQQTKVGATMKELRELAYENNIIPTHRLYGADLKTQLLGDFESGRALDRFRVGFDIRNVRVLQDDMNELSKRTVMEWRGDLITRGEGREILGHQTDGEDDIYYSEYRQNQRPTPRPGTSSRSNPSEFHVNLLQGKQNGNGHYKEVVDGRLDTETINAMVEALDKDRKRLQASFEERITKDFEDFGQQLATAASGVALEQADIERTVYEVVQGFDVEDWKNSTLKDTYEKAYLNVLKTTVNSVEHTLGLSFDVPDEVANQVLRSGGRRVGLIDLTEQTKKRMFDVIEDARKAGEGVDEIVRRIRDEVPAGPWQTAETRAQVIARTEVRHAQRESALTAYKESGAIQTVMIFDARLGPTDFDCEARDGRIVSFSEAEEMMAGEHPNGTLDFAPYGVTAEMEAVE